MDHRYVDEYNIAGRYLLGKLPAGEQVGFEEHFVDCPECLDRLETTENFRSGLQTVAAEEAAWSNAYVQAGVLGWLARFSRRRQAMLLASVVLLLVALPAVLFVTEMRRVRGELEQMKLASAELQRQYEEKQRSARRLAEEAQGTARKLAEERQQLEAELERERQERALLADESKKPGRLYSIASVFPLISVRSADPGQSPTVNQIVVSRSSRLIVLSPELEPDPDVQSYRATIKTAGNRFIWRGDKLQMNPKGAIELGFNSRLFKAGDYLLTFEGLTRQGRYVVVSRYPFRVSEK